MVLPSLLAPRLTVFISNHNLEFHSPHRLKILEVLPFNTPYL